MFPLIKNFRATTIPKAFLLNAIAAALIAALSIEMRIYLDNKDVENTKNWNLTERQKAGIVFITAFVVAIITYYTLHLLTGFGYGMLAL